MSDVYVQVLYDYSYHTEDGNEVKIKAGEELLLIERLNENWWQVIRSNSEHPFYAPSNYLSIIGLKCNKSTTSRDVNSNFSHVIQETHNQKNISNDKVSSNVTRRSCEQKSTKDEVIPKLAREFLSFRNPLCTDAFSSNDTESNKDTSYHVPFSTELNEEQKQFLTDSAANENSIAQDSMSPIYVNIPLSLGRLPPVPKADQAPVRTLTNDWFEYIDEESGRKYYFHSLSGKVTWKPPRRRGNMHSTPLNSEPNSPQFGYSSNVPEPPPKQLKPKLNKLAHSSNESLESQTSPCMFTILPPGWSQESDSSGTVYYHNEASKKRWFSSLDDNGRTYFYDEDSSESVWELPDLSTASDAEVEQAKSDVSEQPNEKDDAQGSVLSKSTIEPMPAKLRKKAPKLPVPRQFKTRSLMVPECVNLSGSEDKGYLPASFGEGYWPSVQDGHFSITRKGTLNKTKLVEGGKRIRKNWTSSFVVLTDVFLLFYKDIRSAHLAIPGMKPELCIDLNGALVEWCPEKSSRKNVFQISTVLGHQLLLQDDNAQTTKEWFDTIHAAIMMLPSSVEQADGKYSLYGHDESFKKEVKLSRSKSTKQYSTKANNEEHDLVIPAEKKRKIRDKLRQFFVRRPTLESLREKGILLDETVFGCHLETLCSRENRTVPKFVSKCIEVIERKELTADGLYRASGNLSQVQKIRIHVNQDDYSCLEHEEDVHVLTGALKMFFREMKEPLFPYNMFGKFLNAIALPDASSKLVALKELVSKLPEPNYETLKVLFEHLLRVTKYHKQNRMQIQNLAIVFGPTLMCSEQTSNNIALDMMHQNRIVEFLLLEFSAIFCVNSCVGQSKNK